MKDQDYTLDFLLEMDGFMAEICDGYWIKIEAKVIKVSMNKPFGVKYSLTLHSPEGERLLGFGNAHAVPGLKILHMIIFILIKV